MCVRAQETGIFSEALPPKGENRALNACPCNGMALQKSPEAFLLERNTLNHAKRSAGKCLNFAVSGDIINAFVHKLEAKIPRNHR